MTDSVNLSARYSYAPDHFRQTDPQRISETFASHPFATLTLSGDSYPLCVHLPFLHLGEPDKPDSWWFESHLARINPVAQALDDQEEQAALLVFHGPNAYINPHWYLDSRETSVPTWNYQAVHVRGRVSLVQTHSDQWLDQHLTQLIATQQTRINATGFDYHQLPERQRRGMLKAIIGLRFMPEAIDAIDKLSQNKTPGDQLSVAGRLQGAESTPEQVATASAMNRSLSTE